MVGAKRSNIGENVTVVATINVAGWAIPPLTIFKGKRVREDWITHDEAEPGATYAVTDSSMMQGPGFVNFPRKFHRWLLDNVKADGLPHVIVLDGHASHVTIDVIQFAMANNRVISQLPPHSSHVTQRLHVSAFRINPSTCLLLESSSARARKCCKGGNESTGTRSPRKKT